MPRMSRPQFTLRALLVAVLVVAAFFGGSALERKRQTRLQIELRSASEAVIGQQSRALQTAQKRIADLERDAEERKTAQRVPTLRRRADRMPTLRGRWAEAGEE